jgi:hypothetical protein
MARNDVDYIPRRGVDESAPPGRFREGASDVDERDTQVTAWISGAGWMIGGAVGVVAGLLASFIPGLGIEWWVGVLIGFFVGITVGALVLGRLTLRALDDEAYGNIPRTTRRGRGSYGPR